MAEYSKYQQKVIKNYYDNIDNIALTKLGELVTNLYLAEGKARARHWKQAVKYMQKLEVPASRIEHLVEQDSPELLANLVAELGKK